MKKERKLKDTPLIKEWSVKNELSPLELTTSSNKKVYWECLNGHGWKTTIKSRYRRGLDCPFCSGSKKLLSSEFPNVAQEWSDRNTLPVDFFTSKNREMAYWECSTCGMEWEARIDSRTHGGNGCPYCYGRFPTENNNLLKVHPLICKEWDYHKNKKEPQEFTPRSGIKVWWKCQICERSWRTAISHRTNGFTGCPFCQKINIGDLFFDSLTEAFVGIQYLEDGIDFEQRVKYPGDTKMICDFFLEKPNTFVEVTGFHDPNMGNNGYLSYADYMSKIEEKENICLRFGYGFQFIQLELSNKERGMVRERSLQSLNQQKP